MTTELPVQTRGYKADNRRRAEKRRITKRRGKALKQLFLRKKLNKMLNYREVPEVSIYFSDATGFWSCTPEWLVSYDVVLLEIKKHDVVNVSCNQFHSLRPLHTFFSARLVSWFLVAAFFWSLKVLIVWFSFYCIVAWSDLLLVHSYTYRDDHVFLSQFNRKRTSGYTKSINPLYIIYTIQVCRFGLILWIKFPHHVR